MNTVIRISLKLVLAAVLVTALELFAHTAVDFVYTGF